MKAKDIERIDRIVQVFKDTQLNQRQFSELIGVSQQLVSTIVTYSKKPNETILFAIIDNISNVDPLWLLTGKGKYTNDYYPPTEEASTPIEFHINTIVEKRFKELSEKVFKKISNIEESIKEANAINVLRRIDQDNSKLISESKKNQIENLGS